MAGMIKLPFSEYPEWQTERIRLNALRSEDAPAISALRSDPEVNRYINRAESKSVEEATAFIQNMHDGIGSGLSLYWALRLYEDEELIGTSCLWNFSASRNSAEIGYELVSHLHRKGLITEVLASMIPFCWESLQLDLLEAYVHRGNEGSLKLLERFGFEITEQQDEKNPDNLILNLKR